MLDLACGQGRHSRFLAAPPCDVVAVDRDAQALAALAGVPRVTTIAADLEGGPWPLAGRAIRRHRRHQLSAPAAVAQVARRARRATASFCTRHSRPATRSMGGRRIPTSAGCRRAACAFARAADDRCVRAGAGRRRAPGGRPAHRGGGARRGAGRRCCRCWHRTLPRRRMRPRADGSTSGDGALRAALNRVKWRFSQIGLDADRKSRRDRDADAARRRARSARPCAS